MESLLTTINTIIISVISWFVSVFQGIGPIFYDAEKGPTLLGFLLLIPAATIIVKFGFNFIVSLIRKIGK